MKNIKAIAIGGFDGMHIGHQALFNELKDSGAIVVIETGYANMTPATHREKFTDYPMFYLELDDIRHLDGMGFVDFLQENFTDLETIVVGYDFHFGKDRRYSFADLKDMFSGEVIVVNEVKHKDVSVHSHKIRKQLKDGDIKVANEFLGHNYSIEGKMTKGQGIGKKELVATINIESEGFLIPKEGVYTTLTRIDNEEHFHPSVSFVGHRETTDGSFAIESHILDGEVQCEEKADIRFVSFIRENEKFDSLESLKKAIKLDIAKASKELKFLQL